MAGKKKQTQNINILFNENTQNSYYIYNFIQILIIYD